MPAIPALFARIPENLLVPLASPLKSMYWEALMVAYHLHQAADHYEVPKETLLDRVEEHLHKEHSESLAEASGDWETLGETPADLTGQRLFAWRLLKQLERCGWFEYEYRREQGQVVRFPDYALNLLAVLEDTARGERPHVQGLAYNVKQILTDPEQQQADPGFVLYQAKNAVASLLRELKVLRANIGRYVEQAAEREQVRDLLALQMNDFWPKVVEPSYQQFKTSDNVLRFRLEILDRLEELSNDAMFLQAAAARVEQQEQLEADEAKLRVYEWLEGMAADIRSLDDLIEEIDARHAHYVGLTLQRIRHRLHRNETTETKLVEMIGTLSQLPIMAEELYEDLLDVHCLQMVGEDSLYRMPHAAEPHQPEPLVSISITETDREAILSNMRDSLANPVSRELVFAEIRDLLAEQPEWELSDWPVADDRDFLRLIALHSYRHEDAAPYEIEIAEDAPWVHAGAYAFRNGHLKLRPQGES